MQASTVLDGKILPPPLDSLVPREVVQALPRGLSRHPEQRIPSMAELLAALAIDHERDAAGQLFVPLDLLMLAGLIAILAQRYFAVLWTLIGLLSGGVALVALQPRSLLWTTGIQYPLLPIFVLYTWNRAARVPPSMPALNPPA